MGNVIEFIGVSYKLPGTSELLLHDLNFSIKKGQIVTIIGPNGGGKTTLAKLILNIIKPSTGQINIQDVSFAYLPQKLHINKMLPINVEHLLEICAKQNSYEYIKNNFPEITIEHLLDRPLSKLSGGQLQTVLFSCILLQNSDVLILDEPTASLDLNATKLFYKIVEKLKNQYNKTLIIISHDIYTVMKSSDHVICLNQHICCEGKPSAVAENKIYKDWFSQADNLITYYEHEHTHEHH
jgi:zinc transport system ATP-binding protein